MTGAYACDALTPSERRAVHAHLRTCAVCTEEVAAFEAVAAQLADAVAVTPPTLLYPHVISEITSARRLMRRARRAQSAEPRRL
jgi:anti-sigma factor RsiW